MNCDVAVVGAGPAGSTAAYQLARRGLRVVIVEKKSLPRPKTCGGGISPKTAALLPAGWQAANEATIQEIIFSYRNRHPLLINYDYPVLYMVTRDQFDHWLVQKAESAGAQLLQGVSATGFDQTPAGVNIHLSQGKLTARALIGADGVHGVVARTFSPPPALRYGFAVEAEVQVDSRYLERYYQRAQLDHGLVARGYSWVFPKQDHLSLGLGSFTFSRGLSQRYAHFHQSLGLGAFPYRLRGYPLPVPLTWQLQLHSGAVMLTGDAAGLVDPFTGEGIYGAVYSGQLAAATLLNQWDQPDLDLQHYSQQINTDLLSQFFHSWRIGNAIYTAPRLVHHLICRYPEIVRRLMAVLYGNDNYHDFYNYLANNYGCLRLLYRWYSYFKQNLPCAKLRRSCKP